MEERKQEIETDHAWLERAGDLVIQRWKPGITLDVATIRSTMLVRHEFFGADPYVIIVVVPEGSRFAMSFLENNQYKGTAVETSIIGMVNVVEEEDVRAIVSLYFAQHPPGYEFAVVGSMSSAQAWAKALLAREGKG
ncbi:MAG: hypothetical protein IPJ76_07005 [Flavobacteriales bacterium]|nr:MAG: hypothetical protein IPJ76_07005 [Flavobacteriales bacterium]